MRFELCAGDLEGCQKWLTLPFNHYEKVVFLYNLWGVLPGTLVHPSRASYMGFSCEANYVGCYGWLAFCAAKYVGCFGWLKMALGRLQDGLKVAQ